MNPIEINNIYSAYILDFLNTATVKIKYTVAFSQAKVDPKLDQLLDIKKCTLSFLKIAKKIKLTEQKIKGFDDACNRSSFELERLKLIDEWAHKNSPVSPLLAAIKCAASYSALCIYFGKLGNDKQSLHYSLGAAKYFGYIDSIYDESYRYIIQTPEIKKAFEPEFKEKASKDLAEKASQRARKRHAESPQAIEKEFIFNEYMAWRRGEKMYRNVSHFHHKMKARCTHLALHRSTLDNWINVWKKLQP
ncbi:hypothetical protein [Polynucleobacter sp. AP-Nino-20-G2]|uniref:hypothetical protein n=1 Tax=Polynucleobacter sp. AP-Nino-20-G2 TaxID=2576917 RepID=UPI001BFD7718|nr:hypothetical protein [Polynucleobacter sp. AP-Nino-20-G2]QWE17539.1 hypothetical protein FD960_04890 [Polynucleobacter sp. AP-Nino-20-G2]